MRFLLTAIFLLTATQAFAEMRQAVCTVTSSVKLNFHSSNWFPPEVVPKGTRMTIQYDEDAVVLTRDTPRGVSREEFTVFYNSGSNLRSVDAQPNKTTILNVGDSDCAVSRGLGTYKGEHRDIWIYTVGDFPTRIYASCPCANLD